ncbi:MAG: hypothetical protein HC782_00080 [Gammaproteobacteria bacterium]|nr:hypothetical protein [Gammaproteobacteria bacterium]
MDAKEPDLGRYAISNDAKDRGVEFRWHNGTTAKLGFFGFDRSTQEFLFVPDATDTADVISGTPGTLSTESPTSD